MTPSPLKPLLENRPDWSWEVVSGHTVLARGLADTMRDAYEQATAEGRRRKTRECCSRACRPLPRAKPRKLFAASLMSLVWREINFGYRGRAIIGSYAISSGRVFAKWSFGEKSAPLGDLPAPRLAQQLLIELVEEQASDQDAKTGKANKQTVAGPFSQEA
jgi:hypothetical protein